MREDAHRGPVPLAFLGQLDLAELVAVAPLLGFPSDGTLAFFFDSSQSAWGYDPLVRGHCRVLFFESSEEAPLMHAPQDLLDAVRFPERKVSFRHEWTLPSPFLNKSDPAIVPLATTDEYEDICSQLMMTEEGDRMHRCGGHPQEIQGDMRLECQLVTHGIYCGDSSGFRDPRVKTLERGAADWRLLIQIDSDAKRLGWTWGDAGRFYFWVRKQDIEARDFDGSWAILQCY